MKNVVIFTLFIGLIFGLLGLVTNMQNKEKAEGNPFNKESLDPATIKQLDDPLYQNIILPNQFENDLKEGKPLTIYFYSPTCSHCANTTPVVVPVAEKLGVNLQLFNLLEFRDGWDQYNIESTPTIVHYENGQEVKRIVGERSEQEFNLWFNDIK